MTPYRHTRAAFVCALLTLIAVPSQAGVTYVQNSYLDTGMLDAASGSHSLTAGIATTGGNPTVFGDENKHIIYGYNPPSRTAGTSFDSLRIDNIDYELGTASNGPVSNLTFSPGNVTGSQTFTAKNVKVTKNIQLSSTLSGVPDNVRFQWTIENLSNQNRNVGLRCMLDTQIGENDGAPIRFSSETAVSLFERQFQGLQVPDYWYAVEIYPGFPGYPGLVAQGTMRGWDTTKPDRVGVAEWSEIYDTVWNYGFGWPLWYNDSAVAMYWDPIILQPGASRTIVTYVGLSSVQTCESRVATVVNSPVQLQSTCGQGYSPNPFTVQAALTAVQQALGVRATLTVPAGFTILTVPTVLLGTMNVNTSQNVNWQVRVDNTLPAATYSMKVTIEGSNFTTCEINRVVVLPQDGTCTPIITPTLTPTPTPSPTPTCDPSKIALTRLPCFEQIGRSSNLLVRVRDQNPGGVSLSGITATVAGRDVTFTGCTTIDPYDVQFCFCPCGTIPGSNVDFFVQYVGRCNTVSEQCKIRLTGEQTPVVTPTPPNGEILELRAEYVSTSQHLTLDLGVTNGPAASPAVSLYVVLEVGGVIYFLPSFSSGAVALAGPMSLPGGFVSGWIPLLDIGPIAPGASPIPLQFYGAFLTGTGTLYGNLASASATLP